MSTLVCLCTDWLPTLPLPPPLLLPVMPLVSALHAELLGVCHLFFLPSVIVIGLGMLQNAGHMTVMMQYGLHSCSKL